MSLNYQALQEKLIGMVVDTRQGILAIYNDSDNWDVETKADDSPLTAADQYIHNQLMLGLSKLTDDIPILSEESELPAWEIRQSWSRYWIIDPLDGTKEFIKRTGEFTVNVALIENNEPVLSVVYIPVENSTFAAIKGQGSIRINEAGRKVITCNALKAPAKILASRSHRSEKLEGWLKKYEQLFGTYDVISAGSSLKFCRIAEGVADLYPRLGLTSEWDTAAAQLIVEEAGGVVLKSNGNALDYNTKDNILNPFFLVAGDKTQDWSALLPDFA